MVLGYLDTLQDTPGNSLIITATSALAATLAFYTAQNGGRALNRRPKGNEQGVSSLRRVRVMKAIETLQL